MQKRKSKQFFLGYALLIYVLVIGTRIYYNIMWEDLYLGSWTTPLWIGFLYSALIWLAQSLVLFWPGILDLGLHFGKLTKKEYLFHLALQWMPVLFFLVSRKISPSSFLLVAYTGFYYRLFYYLILGNILGLMAYFFVRMTRKR